MPSIVRMSLYSNIRSYSAHSLTSWVSGQHRVSMELRRCLPANTPYISGHVIDHGSDTPVESFVVHSPNIGKVGPGYEGRLALFLIFLSNVPCV
jgi:ribulose bisphosphate carboxylase small subunit